MKYTLLTIAFLLSCIYGISQGQGNTPQTDKDSVGCKVISISTDGMQYILNQPNISIECAWDRYSIGLYGGIVIPSHLFAVNPLAAGQYTNPGTVYSGAAFKLYFKYYEAKKLNHYWAIQLEYKPEYFNNVSFYDEVVQDEVVDNYTMNEKTTVFGIDLLRGYELNELSIPNVIHADFFFGFGVHVRDRDYTVISNTYSGGFGGREYMPYVGTYKASVVNYTPVIGLKIGFNYFTKK